MRHSFLWNARQPPLFGISFIHFTFTFWPYLRRQLPMVSGHEIDLHKLYTIIPMRVYDREPSNKFIAGYRNLFLHFLSKTVQEQDLANKSLNPNLQKKDTKQIKIKKKNGDSRARKSSSAALRPTSGYQSWVAGKLTTHACVLCKRGGLRRDGRR